MLDIPVPEYIKEIAEEVNEIRNRFLERIITGQSIIQPQDCQEFLDKMRDLRTYSEERMRGVGPFPFHVEKLARLIGQLDTFIDLVETMCKQETFYLEQVAPYEVSLLKQKAPTLIL